MPETKYTTAIYLAVHSTEVDSAGKAATLVYQDLVGRLLRAAPGTKQIRLQLDEPTPRKGDEGVFACWGHLKAVVPAAFRVHTLHHAVIPSDNARDAWRSMVRTQFNLSCHEYHDLVHHTSSRVETTREVLPHEEAPQTEAAPAEEKPKEMIPVKVTLGGKVYDVEIPKGENLLDGVNDKGVDVKWDCKSGVCDTCKIQVINGGENLSAPNDAEDEMLGDEVKKGYRLSCQVTANGPCEIKH